ncbi:MAG: hypothetical protein ACYCZF_06410 [Anaerolineae bacterium]
MTSASEEIKPRQHPWRYVVDHLQARRAGDSEADLDEFEIALQRTLRPVNPTVDFRDGLRNNLAVAAKRRYVGLEIEARQSYGQGLLVGAILGIAAALFGTIVYVLFRPHPQPAEDQ